MAISQAQKEQLDRLCLESGGIFGDKDKKDPAPKPMIIIGLGGLGCRTLNELKRKVDLQIRNYEKFIHFLAIDSDQNDMRDLKASSHKGYLDENTEITDLYDPSIAMIIQKKVWPEYNKKWMTPNWVPTVNGSGCGQIRENGRFLLSVPAVYSRVHAAIKSKIVDARNALPPGSSDTNVNVIFIAGISGGTGSGTFIDIAYITHNIFQQLHITNYKIAGYIYTPDVQFGNPKINTDALKRNGFAALKELDYYMNIFKTKGKYVWPFDGSKGNDVSRNIYNTCVLVTGTDETGSTVGGEAKCMDALTETLMLALADNNFTVGGVPVQMIDSLMDNNYTDFNTWSSMGSGRDNNVYPKTCNYVYNVIGYGSVKIPVDYIMTYIANKMFEYAMSEYNKIPEDGEINALMSQVGLVDYEQSVDGKIRNEYAGGFVPTVKKPSIGDIKNGTDKFWDYVNDMAVYYNDIVNKKLGAREDKFINDIYENIIRLAENHFDASGPYYVNRLLSHEGTGIQGVIVRIRDIASNQCNRFYERLIETYGDQNDLKRAISGVCSRAKKGFIFGGDKPEDVLAAIQSMISDFYLSRNLAKDMFDKLMELSNRVTTYNNNLFGVYVEVMDHIGGLLNRDANKTIQGIHSENAYTAYAIDTNNNKHDNPVAEILYKYLDEIVLNDDFKNQFFKGFDGIIKTKDPKVREEFTSSDMNKFNVVSIMREEFNNLLQMYSSDAIERFLVVFYGNLNANNLKQSFDTCWTNEAEKKNAMNIAATNIRNQLTARGKLLYQPSDGHMVYIAGKKFVTCPQEAPLLEATLKSLYAQDPDIQVCSVPRGKSVDLIENEYGLALAKISGIPEAMSYYDASLLNDKDNTVHLDGSVHSDYSELPSIVPQEMFDNLHCSSEIELRNLNKINGIIDEALVYGLLERPKSEGEPYTYSYYENAADLELNDEILSSMANSPAINANMTKTDIKNVADNILKENGIKTLSGDVKMEFSGFTDLDSEKTMRLIVRKNMDLYRNIRDSLRIIKALVEPVENKLNMDKARKENYNKFEKDITKFCRYINLGLIKLDPMNQKDWLYDDNDGRYTGYIFDANNDDDFITDNIVYFAFKNFLNLKSEVANALSSIADEYAKNGSAFPDPVLAAKITPIVAKVTNKPKIDEATGRVNTDNVSKYNLTLRFRNEEAVLNKCNSNALKGYFTCDIGDINNPYDLLIEFYKLFKEKRSHR